MQNISFKINYGNAVSTLPARAFDFIISGSATPNDIKTLLVACSLPPDNLSTSVLSEKTGMNPESVNRSLAFWQSVGLLTISVSGYNSAFVTSPENRTAGISGTFTENGNSETVKDSANTEKAEQRTSNSSAESEHAISNTINGSLFTAKGTLAQADGVSDPTKTEDKTPNGGAGTQKGANKSAENISDTENKTNTASVRNSHASDNSEKTNKGKTETKNKVLPSEEMPNYTGSEIAEIISRGGEKTAGMLETCQQLIGHLFSPAETSAVIGLHDWLGLDAEYIITLFAYYVEKKPGCNVRYIEKAAVGLVNKEITDLAALDTYFRNLEFYDTLSGKLRTLTGIGGRAFTTKENKYINQWIEMGFDFDMIKTAYDQCCDSTGKFNFSYANTILENWYKAGIKTPEDAAKESENHRTKSKQSAGSFDTDEFFSLALRKSYQKMSGK